MIHYYILENDLPKAVDLMTWSNWLETHPNRDIKRTVLEDAKIQVITVFLPLPDIDFVTEEGSEECKEIVRFYGTMVFGGAMHEHEEKYFTREEAEDGHERLLMRVKAILDGRIGPPDCCKKSNTKAE